MAADGVVQQQGTAEEVFGGGVGGQARRVGGEMVFVYWQRCHTLGDGDDAGDERLMNRWRDKDRGDMKNEGDVRWESGLRNHMMAGTFGWTRKLAG
ncbi:hypothetical protein Tco_0640326 [Tanacetum coccineum]